MSDQREKKHPQNVSGRFYVTLDCLACEACQEVAPNHFRYGEHGLTYVFNQPTTSDELRQCQDAMAGCPLEAIKDDGALDPTAPVTSA